MDGFDIAARALSDLEREQSAAKATELEALANDLRRRGGGFTAHAESRLRVEVGRLRGRVVELRDAPTTVCVYCERPTYTGYDEHPECVERAAEEALAEQP